ncbi:hypothetical protein E4T38_08577 [Aureobasidium subglaciale]|nr:hypothetical protein E4T38_08577 [Aureobasidium subglaciale]KAI5215144.1 hypothetical protein E4T40_08590 [Aureobasidium subglaciale]KAI5218296.1 hypothetical protein E4T41_08443 [Aureobasidium subglaciale]KAI5256029.1 hypothetical protein E4T46_08478 [Aureobasidium subglaciale]
MRTSLTFAAASLLTSTSALAFNGTAETVTVTRTSWSTIISTLSCPAPTTVTLCNAQCTASPVALANNANIVYQTLSECQAGQVVTIYGTETTLLQPTTLAVEKTISDLVVIPGSATDKDYTAVATITNVVYPSSLIANNGQVVTCQTGVTKISGNGVTLTNCPCTVQTTVFEVIATGSGAVPTALVPSTKYIVKIIYVYVIEYIVEQVPTTLTRTATSTLTTIRTETETEVTTTTAAPSSLLCPSSMATVNDVVFMVECDTSYEGVGASNLRKRQAINLPGVSADLYSCGIVELFLGFDEPFNIEKLLGSFKSVIIDKCLIIVSSWIIHELASQRLKLNVSWQPLDPTSSSVAPITESSSSLSSSSSTMLPVTNSSIISTTSTSTSSSSSSMITPIANSTSSTILPGTNSSTSTTSSTTPVVPLTNCEVSNDLLDYDPAYAYCYSVYPVTAATSLFDATITEIITTSGPASTLLSNVTLATETLVQTIETATTTTVTIPTELTITDIITIFYRILYNIHKCAEKTSSAFGSG